MAARKTPYDTLPEIKVGARPKVLLVGNGINLSFPGAASPDEIIQNEWKAHYGFLLPSRNDKANVHEIWKLPLPLQVVAATKDHVQGCMTMLAKKYQNMDVSPEQKGFIQHIVDMGFDTILSTNYSLEFEKSTIADCSPGKVQKRYITTQEQTPQQKQFGIYQCTELPDAKKTALWHIHGTAFRQNSLVMGQLYYGKLLSEVITRANYVNGGYRRTNNQNKPFYPKSWIDYYLIGDLHIFGFGYDLSETDLRWLLSYK